MSPRPYRPHWRHPQHNISPQHHYHANQQHRYYQPLFVTPYSSPPQQYYYDDSPCNLHYHQFNMASNDAAEASRPNKKSKVEQPATKATKAPVPGKGLRHFSMKICDRVKSKGSTSYSEVADELIKELREDEAKAYQATAESTPAPATNGKSKRNKPPPSKYDEKNIRRRVYDALNVLMAMDIIVKDKKMIVWNGLPGERTKAAPPSNTDESPTAAPKSKKDIQMPSEQLLKLQEERSKLQANIQRKRMILQELITQNVCFNNLYQRNHAREVVDTTSSSKAAHSHSEEKIPLPFIVVNTAPSTVIQCEMCPQKIHVNFDFSTPFEINDDNEILKRIGMDGTTEGELNRILPGDLRGYCDRWGLVDGVLRRGRA